MLNSNKMPVVSIQRHRMNTDGEGVRTLVHSYRCNLACKWCCNPETRYQNKFVLCTPKELFNTVRLDDIYFITTNGGITFSGGEPLLYKEFIREFSELAHSYNWRIGVESAFNFTDISDVDFIDDFLIDIKTMNEDIHQKYTGSTNKYILNNIQKLAEKRADDISISIPIIPTVNDSVENLINTISFVKSCGITKMKLLPYRDYNKEKYEPMKIPYELDVVYDENQFKKLQEILRKELL